jgi:hypothetical protein
MLPVFAALLALAWERDRKARSAAPTSPKRPPDPVKILNDEVVHSVEWELLPPAGVEH